MNLLLYIDNLYFESSLDRGVWEWQGFLPILKNLIEIDAFDDEIMLNTKDKFGLGTIEFQAQFDPIPTNTDNVQAVFNIFDQESNGQLLWTSKTWNLNSDQTGYYSVKLGDTSQNDLQIPTELFFQHQDILYFSYALFLLCYHNLFLVY